MVRATALRDQHDDAGGYCHGEQAGYQRDDNGGALRIMGAGLAQFIDRIGSSVRLDTTSRGLRAVETVLTMPVIVVSDSDSAALSDLLSVVSSSLPEDEADCSFSPEAVSMF